MRSGTRALGGGVCDQGAGVYWLSPESKSVVVRMMTSLPTPSAVGMGPTVHSYSSSSSNDYMLLGHLPHTQCGEVCGEPGDGGWRNKSGL